jgi:hypothetical protein
MSNKRSKYQIRHNVVTLHKPVAVNLNTDISEASIEVSPVKNVIAQTSAEIKNLLASRKSPTPVFENRKNQTKKSTGQSPTSSKHLNQFINLILQV